GRACQMLRKCTARLFNSALLLLICWPLPGRADEPRASGLRSEPEDQAYEELADQVAELDRFSRVFEAVSKLVSPTVVHIQSRKAASIMERSFTYDESGSGVVVRLPGYPVPYVLTNHHVVENVHPEQLLITTSD